MTAEPRTLLPAVRHALRRSRVAEDGGAKQRLRCPACGWTHWNNPTPVLAAVIECTDRDGPCCWRAMPPGRAACSR
jgi:NAD+ diphosphatase